MNRIKIVKKGEVLRRCALISSPEIPVQKPKSVKTREIVENWVSDWRLRRQNEKQHNLEKIQSIKSVENFKQRELEISEINK